MSVALHYEDEDAVDAVDKEWEDFARLVAQRQRDQAFYPSPLVTQDDEDYVSINVWERENR